MEPIVIRLAGAPRGKQRAKHTVRGGVVRTYTPKETRRYEASVAKVARAIMGDRPPIVGPVGMVIHFRMPIPKSAPKRDRIAMAAGEIAHISKPDLSNMIKSIEDAFNGIVFGDDCQIVRMLPTKGYSERPGVDVRIEAFAPQGGDA